MFSLILVTLVIVLLVGLAIKLITDHLQTVSDITWFEYGVGSAVCAVVLIPIVVAIGWHMSIGSLVKYHEQWGGFETKAIKDTTVCHEDGSCNWTYDCDPYTVTDVSTDANGNTTTSSHTEYRSCPYVTREYDYYVDTTLGKYTIGSSRFSTDPHVWRSSDGEGIPRDAGRGEPAFWRAAKDRIDAGDNGPVVKNEEYDNFLLASQSTILKKWSAAKDKYLKAKLLPKVDYKITSHYYNDKVSFPGFKLRDFPNWEEWERAVMREDAALGTDLQGDMRVIIVPASKVTNPPEYIGALQAYWEGPELGKYDISKNGIILVLAMDDAGVDQSCAKPPCIAWAEAATGMPLGNEQMLAQLEDELPGHSLDPTELFGHPRIKFGKHKSIVHQCLDTPCTTHGVVEDILWGKNKFERICMSCEDKGDKGTGFLYLKNELQPTGGQKFWIEFVAFLLCGAVWGAALLVGVRPGSRRY